MDDDIDYFVLTHADSDHIGGAINVLQSFDVETIYTPKIADNTIAYTEFEDYVTSNNYKTQIAEDDEKLNIAGCKITFLSAGEYDDENDASYVLKVEYLNKSFLFTGDIGKTVEADLIDKYNTELDCDVLKVAHHGSDTSTSYSFLEAVTPEYAIISCGINNRWNFPKDIVISNLNVIGANIHRTDLDGNAVFVVSENYNLVKLVGDYTMTNLSLDYRFLILTIQAIIIFGLVMDTIKLLRKRKKLKD